MAEIIVYFSRKGNNYVNGAIKNLTTGNAEVIANMLQELTNADIFKIEPVIPYSSDYSECIEEAKEDKRHNTRLSSNHIPKIWINMTQYIWAIPITGVQCPW